MNKADSLASVRELWYFSKWVGLGYAVTGSSEVTDSGGGEWEYPQLPHSFQCYHHMERALWSTVVNNTKRAVVCTFSPVEIV